LKYYVLIIYDRTDNKRRAKLVKIMKSFGFRVQKSVFEARLADSKYKKMLAKLYPIAEDSIRVYKIRGEGAVTVIGKNDTVEDEEVVII
jgi:CRISPR-associated protein Cas2